MTRRPIIVAVAWLLACPPVGFGLRAAAQTRGGAGSVRGDAPVSPCNKALAERAVCSAASARALELLRSSGHAAVTVVQDVRTGALVAFAASRPEELDVTTRVGPLSLSKVLVAASWWDNRQPDASFDSTRGKPDAENPAYRSRVSVHETIVGGSDSAGRQMALALRRAVGTKKVLEDFRRYGFGPQTIAPRDEKFWGERAPVWAERLTPAPAYVSLNEETADADWAESLSLGETDIGVTSLHLCRFMQAVGNGGLMLTPVAREEREATRSRVSRGPNASARRAVTEETARRLRSALLDTVRRGTATSVAGVLKETGWQIGGKTGSGPALLPKGAEVDGWFAGLVFDPQGRARFAFATFVRSGGYGAGHAARISAELARFIVGSGRSASVALPHGRATDFHPS